MHGSRGRDGDWNREEQCEGGQQHCSEAESGIQREGGRKERDETDRQVVHNDLSIEDIIYKTAARV